MHIIDYLEETFSKTSWNKSVKWYEHRVEAKTEWSENWKQDVEKKDWTNERLIKGIIIANYIATY